ISISGRFDLGKSGFAKLVERILNQAGFQVNPKKHVFGNLADGATITKIRIVDGHPDVQEEYARQVWQELRQAESLSKARPFHGHFLTRAQLAGKIQFISWVNPSRKRTLKEQFMSIDWKGHLEEAIRRGLVRKVNANDQGHS